MKRALWLALLPAIVAGCLDGGKHAASHGAGVSDLPLTESSPPAQTALRFSYPVGTPVVGRSHLPGCPSVATCQDVRMPIGCGGSLTSCPPKPWLRIANRRLTCSPSGGDYSDPKAACAALNELQHIRLHHGGVCYCAFLPGRRAEATGRYNGRRISIPLDPCSLCGLGAQAAHDAAVLMPQT